MSTSWSDLAGRVERWKKWRRFNEQATIQGLVLPALALLGYETDNPEKVFPQNVDDNGERPDLQLYKQGSAVESSPPEIVLEAKSLDRRLDTREVQKQVIGYMTGGEARWYCLTNGLEWRLYDRNLPIGDCLVLTLSLEDPGSSRALELLIGVADTSPNPSGAARALIDARLQEAIELEPWADQINIWHRADALLKGVQQALKSLRSRFASEVVWVEQREAEIRKALEARTGQPPSFVSRPSESLASLGTDVTTQPDSQPVAPSNLPLSPQEGFKNFTVAFVAYCTWAYQRDSHRASPPLKLLPPDYEGPLTSVLLPDGLARLCTNYRTSDKKQLLELLVVSRPVWGLRFACSIGFTFKPSGGSPPRQARAVGPARAWRGFRR